MISFSRISSVSFSRPDSTRCDLATGDNRRSRSWVSTPATAQDARSLPIDLNQDNVDKNGEPIVNSMANDGAAALSWDGPTMIFYSNCAGGFGGHDLDMSTRERTKDVGHALPSVRMSTVPEFF
jgi:hypothetical protein